MGKHLNMIDEINFNDNRFEAVMAAGWIKDLESSDSRLHKEKTIEKKWQCVIKNRNIFANIKRKQDLNGNTKTNSTY